MFSRTARTARWSLLPSLLVLTLTAGANAGPASPKGASAQAGAPQASQPALAMSDKIPFDPAVTTGTLPNGLRYYIRKNGRPEKRVTMHLAVKAGSVDETDQQQGLAHFLEHMAFNGTRRFKAGELIAALESTGARMGPHVNAYTSFDETVYMFQLPTDREGVALKGLQALADFAGGMLLEPAEIDKERGVVIEEWRGGLGVGARLRDQQIPVLYHQSKYAERLPIGKPEVLKSFTRTELRAFYTKWYRPDRMAVIVVGEQRARRGIDVGGGDRWQHLLRDLEFVLDPGTGLTEQEVIHVLLHVGTTFTLVAFVVRTFEARLHPLAGAIEFRGAKAMLLHPV